MSEHTKPAEQPKTLAAALNHIAAGNAVSPHHATVIAQFALAHEALAQLALDTFKAKMAEQGVMAWGYGSEEQGLEAMRAILALR